MTRSTIALAIASVVAAAAFVAVGATNARAGVSPALLGDVNCDAQVDSLDIALLLQLDAGFVTRLPCMDAADTNGDGDVSSIDATLLLQLDAGLISVLPGASLDAVDAAIRATAELAEVPEDQIVLSSKEAQFWPNGCLGLAEPKEFCTLAIVPGFRITLKVWFQEPADPPEPSPTEPPIEYYTWRTDDSGSQVRLESIAVP